MAVACGRSRYRSSGDSGSVQCSHIRRCVMVRSPLHDEIFAVNGYNIVVFNNNVVIIHIHMGTIYTFMATKYICIVAI